jgi:hypothetical protein
MSRVWTVITMNNKTGETGSTEFDGSFDCATAREQFTKKYPRTPIVALMPGKIEVMTYPVAKPVNRKIRIDKSGRPTFVHPDELDDHF